MGMCKTCNQEKESVYGEYVVCSDCAWKRVKEFRMAMKKYKDEGIVLPSF